MLMKSTAVQLTGSGYAAAHRGAVPDAYHGVQCGKAQKVKYDRFWKVSAH